MHPKQWWISVEYIASNGETVSPNWELPNKATAMRRFREFARRNNVLSVTLYQGPKRILHSTTQNPCHGE